MEDLGGLRAVFSMSVIIPAHNEQDTIAECLDAVLASEGAADFDVVVVANGCTDETAARVREYAPAVRLIETSVGSKAVALELGRTDTADGPRVYLDADIVLSPDALAAAFGRLQDEGVEGTAPGIDLAVPESSTWFLHQYARVWKQAPYFQAGLIGSGFYGLSQTASDRIGPWPTLIADDLVALCHLEPGERRTSSGWFRHTLPTRLRDVRKVEVRREAGRIEFAEWAERSGKSLAEENPGGGWLREFVKMPRAWPGLVLFVLVKLEAKRKARRAYSDGNVGWGQDEHGRKARAGAV